MLGDVHSPADSSNTSIPLVFFECSGPSLCVCSPLLILFYLPCSEAEDDRVACKSRVSPRAGPCYAVRCSAALPRHSLSPKGITPTGLGRRLEDPTASGKKTCGWGLVLLAGQNRGGAMESNSAGGWPIWSSFWQGLGISVVFWVASESMYDCNSYA